MKPEPSIYGGINPTGELGSNHFTLSYISSINNSSFEESYNISAYLNSSLIKSADERTKNFEEEFFTKHGSEIFSGTGFTYVNGKIKYVGKRTEDDFKAARDKLWNNVEELWAKRYSSDKESLDAIEHLVYSNMVVPKIKIEEKTFGEKVKILGKKIKNYFTGQDTQAAGVNPGVYQAATPGAEINVNFPNQPISQEQYLTPSKSTKKKWSTGKKVAVGLVAIGTIAGLGIAGAYLASQNSNNANPFAGEVTIKGSLFDGWTKLNYPSTIHDPYSPDNKEISAYLVFGSIGTAIFYKSPANPPCWYFKAIGKYTSDSNEQWKLLYARILETSDKPINDTAASFIPKLGTNSSLHPTAADLQPLALNELINEIKLPQDLKAKVMERKEMFSQGQNGTAKFYFFPLPLRSLKSNS